MGSRFRTASLLVLLGLTMAPRLWAGEIAVRQIGNFVLELSGGTGANAWHLQYGTNFRPSKYVSLAGPGSIAYFGHYNWLRRIDTEKGVVTGRWMYPGTITYLGFPDGPNGKVRVDVNLNSDYLERKIQTYEFDPGSPQNSNAKLIFADVARSEGLRALNRERILRPATVQQIIPELENAVRRDPLSPWLRIALGRFYMVVKNPDAERLIDEGVRLESAHYSELLEISTFLDDLRQYQTARIAFDRAYEQLWRTGQDPRLINILMVTGANIEPRTPEVFQRDLINRAYSLSPWVDGAAKAWKAYGNFLVNKGDQEEGAKWLARAEEATQSSLSVESDGHYVDSLLASLLAATFLTGAILYAAALYFRYRPQRLARRKAEQAAGVSRPGFANVEYWRRHEKAAFLSAVAIAWFSQGYANSALSAASSQMFSSFYELRTGSLLSPVSIEGLASRPPLPERDLLLGMAYQRDEQNDKAESLYRKVPQFAEAWNNLGVLLKNAGKNDEARQAFERALAIRPDFPEAEWNLSKPARGDWVAFHAKYLPEKAMPTVPTQAEFRRGYEIKGKLSVWLDILRGPLNNFDRREEFYNEFRSRDRFRTGLMIFCAAGSLILLFIRPREVVQEPSRWQLFLELLIPGTARAWGILGGVVVGFACYCSSAFWPVAWKNFYVYYNYGGRYQRFPLPYGLVGGRGLTTLSAIPPFTWVAAVLVVNLAVVLFWKWKRKSPIIPKSAAPSSSG